MLHFKKLNSVMEPETIQKNGASLKSQMSRGNFLVALCGVLLAAGAIFSGCNKDEEEPLVSDWFDGKIVATVEKGTGRYYNEFNSVLTKVAAMVWDEQADDMVELATGSYANGGFTLTLPTPDSKYLQPMLGKEGINVSDKNAKVLMTDDRDIVAFKPDYYDGHLFQLFYGKADKNSITSVVFAYADRDVTVTGSVEDHGRGFRISLSLKKGWNRVYETETEGKEEITTKPVSGVKWYFESDFSDLENELYDKVQNAPVRSGARRSLFKR